MVLQICRALPCENILRVAVADFTPKRRYAEKLDDKLCFQSLFDKSSPWTPPREGGLGLQPGEPLRDIYRCVADSDRRPGFADGRGYVDVYPRTFLADLEKFKCIMRDIGGSEPRYILHKITYKDIK